MTPLPGALEDGEDRVELGDYEVPGALEDGEDGVELGIMKCQALLKMVKMELNSGVTLLIHFEILCLNTFYMLGGHFLHVRRTPT